MLNRFYFVLFFVLLAIVVVALFVSPTISASAEVTNVDTGIPYLLTLPFDTANLVSLSATEYALSTSFTITYNNTEITSHPTYVRFIGTSIYFTQYSNQSISAQGVIRYNSAAPYANTWRYNNSANTSYQCTGTVIFSAGLSSLSSQALANLRQVLTLPTPNVVVTNFGDYTAIGNGFTQNMEDSLYTVRLENTTSSAIFTLQRIVDGDWVTFSSNYYTGTIHTLLIAHEGTYRVKADIGTEAPYVTYYSTSIVVSDNLDGYSYTTGYTEGYNAGMLAAPDILPSLVFAVPDTIIGMLIGTYDTNPDSDTYHTYVGGLFNFNLFGYDMRDFIVSLVCIVVIVKLIALILGGTGKEE